MSQMLDRVAEAIEQALEKPRYVVMVKLPCSFELWDGEEKLFSCNNHTHVDNMCDKLNNQHAAKKAVEALKDTPLLCYNDYRCDDLWENLNSTKVWYLWYNAILKS